ncbi:MAG: VWA domain-containing protein, partial [Calditrichales bacterium]
MFDWIPDYLHSNISLFVFVGAIAAGAAIGYYQYRQTVPPISQRLRIFLGSLRGFAIFLIVLLIFAPEITAVFQTNQSRHIALLIDQSASMGIRENGRSRMERALDISENLRSQIGDNARISIYAFDNDTVGYTTLDLDTTANGTDIGGSLRAILHRYEDLNAVILISDGNSTIGDNPLY